MILDQKITVKNYRCFDTSGGGFEKIYPINLIIGKNNSGKSSLIELIKYSIQKSSEFVLRGRDNFEAEIYVEHQINEQEIPRVFRKDTGSGLPGVGRGRDFDYGIKQLNKKILYRLMPNGDRQFISLLNSGEIQNNLSQQEIAKFTQLASSVVEPFESKIFCQISAERDIRPESDNSNFKDLLESNGEGLTNYIQRILNDSQIDNALIEKTLLVELNNIINPEISLSRILVQLNDNGKWELYFYDLSQKRIPLSKMGSGIKTVIQVLINLIVRPEIENRKPSNYVFAFEELENNLHPSLQRRLFEYIRSYSQKNQCYFFLTTHSNVAIDAFGTDHNSQIIHVIHDGNKSESRTILSYEDQKRIIDDLGIRASDLLQSNGIIWVEGPSDRNYVKRWIELINPNLIEGYHYSIMFYGGKLLANLSLDYESIADELVPLLKINRNAFVIMDLDGKSASDRVRSTKLRIQNEIGESNCWITKGREIENYLTKSTLENWLSSDHNLKIEVETERFDKLEDTISESIIKTKESMKIEYAKHKTKYSSEIVKFIEVNDLDFLNLRHQIELIVNQITTWNK